MATRPTMRRRRIAALLLGVLAAAASASAEIAPEKVGNVFTLPARPGPHWFWASDVMLHRTTLFDGDDGRMLGTISSGAAGSGFVIFPLFSPSHDEIYIAETYWSRGIRGERSDVVTVYDSKTLLPKAEIPIPAKRGEYFPGNASNAISDDGRFVAVFNITPATSLTIVDVKERRFAGEVETPGCSLVYSAGPRRFFMLCANGSALVVDLDDRGTLAKVERTEPFFDAVKDPITEKAVRRDNEWIFTSYDGVIHTVDVKGPQLAFGPTWSLLDDADRADQWRIGGLQHLAVHSASGTLYALMHQGPRDTHKDPGTEVWLYDIEERRRTQKFVLPNPVVSFIADQARFGTLETQGLGARVARAAMEASFDNPGVERIVVTQDENPLLITSSGFPPTITIHDARTGQVRTEISEPGLGFSLFFTP
jgi:methylamine dehydrogenase heavy chain